MKYTLKGLATALAITIGAAGAITIPASLTTAPIAEAFGISDIGGAIKGAGKKVGGAAKKAGKAVGGAAKKTGKAIGKGAKVVGKGVGKGVYKFGEAEYVGWKHIGKWTGQGIKMGAGKVWDGTKWVGRQANKSAIVKGVVEDAKTSGKWIGRNTKKGAGKAWDGTKWVGRQAEKSDLVKGAINDAKKIGRGIKSVAGKLRATAKAPRENSVTQAIGNKRHGAKRKTWQDRSNRNRFKTALPRNTVGGKPQFLKLSRDKSLAKTGRTVQGITKDNLQPRRKVKGFATRDVKRDLGNQRKSLQSNQSRRKLSDARRNGQSGMSKDWRSQKQVNNKRPGNKKNNRNRRRR